MHSLSAASAGRNLVIFAAILPLSFGIVFNLQKALGVSGAQAGMLTVLGLLVIGVSLVGRARWPRIISTPLVMAVAGLTAVMLTQGLIRSMTLRGLTGRGLPSILIEVATTMMPLLVVLASLSAYWRSRRPARPVLLVLLIAGLLIFGIVQVVLRAPLVWTGTPGGTEWAPIIWKGDYLGYGNEYTVRAFSLFYSPVQYGMVAAATACAGAAWATTRRASRWWSVPLLLLGLASTWASANRTVEIGLVAGLIMMLVMRRAPHLRLTWLVVIPVALTVTLLVGGGIVHWAIDQQLVSQQYVRTLLIRLDDFPGVLTRVFGSAEQALIGSVDFAALTRITQGRTDGATALPIDNELLYLVARFGVWGPLLMLAVWAALMAWAQREWRLWHHPALLALIGLLGTWAVGQNVNVLYMHALPAAAVLIALGVRSRASLTAPVANSRSR